MQTIYHIKGREIETFMHTIRKLVEDDQELTITVSSDEAFEEKDSTEKEKLFYSLFGSWEGEQTGDELTKQIYSDRLSGKRDIDL
ncbi:hypothetical protein [Siphonobacter sp. SORGH_AS_1065]|uniref:hypothetical protein n=1 Tax=Siphonobacter sp. SORGH_AS_1065 TaxID=3041795 RepID=UPI0027851FF4|nr:hypothetical protein [Siphonobacter sp. SORGH_AS_1065]MDQ1090556.1 hypothetical protein [Siphonobacter sp. SORGH_AS_1065]